MMKRLSPNIFTRVKHGFSDGLKTLIASIGILGTIIGALAATGILIPMEAVIAVGAGCLVFSTGVTFIKGHIAHLPDKVIFEENKDESFTASFCTAQTLSQANSLTKPFYRHEYVKDEIAELWRQRNPKGFVHILNIREELCACFGILAFETSFMKQFVKGRVVDNDLRGEDILDFNETSKARQIYISGVVVRDPNSLAGHRRACVMIWAMLKYIENFFGYRKKRTIYALAVSKESKNILERCNFKIASHSTQRKDGIDLYYLDITKKNIENLFLRFGDYSYQCVCEFLDYI